jgi:hypothetical protein
LDQEFQALRFKYVDILRSALDSGDPKIALAAVSLIDKSTMNKKDNELAPSAEDVVRMLMNDIEESPKPQIDQEGKLLPFERNTQTG